MKYAELVIYVKSQRAKLANPKFLPYVYMNVMKFILSPEEHAERVKLKKEIIRTKGKKHVMKYGVDRYMSGRVDAIRLYFPDEGTKGWPKELYRDKVIEKMIENFGIDSTWWYDKKFQWLYHFGLPGKKKGNALFTGVVTKDEVMAYCKEKGLFS
jgi:hypothetical protein